MAQIILQPHVGSISGEINNQVTLNSTWEAYAFKETSSSTVRHWYSEPSYESATRYFDTSLIPIGSTITAATFSSVRGTSHSTSASATSVRPDETVNVLNSIVIGSPLEITFVVKGSKSGAYPSNPTSIGQTTSRAHRYTGNWTQIVVIVDYIPPYTACSAPTSISVASASVGKSVSTTLSWSGAGAGTYNAITAYQILRSTDGGSTYSLLTTVNTTATSGSTTVTAAATNGTTYYYKIKTIGTQSGYDSGDSSAYAALTAQWSAVSAPTTITLNNKNVLYVGNSSIPTITISWNGAGGGTNNPITKYHIYANGTYLAETTSTSYNVYPTATTTYTIYSIGTGDMGNSGASAGRVVNILAANSSYYPTFTNSFPSATGSAISVSWTRPTISNYTPTYQISCGPSGSETLLGTTTSNTYSVTPNVARGTKFVVKVISYIAGLDGGQTANGTISSSQITYGGAFTIPSPFWLSCKDTGNTASGAITTYCYTNCALSFARAQATSVSGSNFTYKMKYRVNDGTWGYTTASIDVSGTYPTITNSLASISPGANVSFCVEITDEYSTIQTSEIITITKLTLPIVSSATITTINSYNIEGNFVYARTNDSYSELTYKVYLIYNTNELQIASGTTSTADVSNTISFTGNTNLRTGTGSFYTALYQEVITNKNVYPAGTLRIELRHQYIQADYGASTKGFTYNYFIDISNIGTFTTTYTHSTYFNPQDTIPFALSGITWADAAGGTSGGTVSYWITQGARNISTSNLAANDVAQSASADLSITYTLNARVEYANGIQSNKTKTLTINIARWTQDSVSFDNISLTSGTPNNTLSGELQLPNELCSSSLYNNLSKIDISYYNGTTLLFTQTNVTIPASKKISFSYATSANELNVIAQATFTNTSSRTIVSSTRNSHVFFAEATLSMRKNRVGINVPNFNNTDSTTVVIQENPSKDDSFILDILGKSSSKILLRDNSIYSTRIGQTSTFSYITNSNGIDSHMIILNNLATTNVNNLLQIYDGTTYNVYHSGMTNAVPVTQGGTGATSAAAALTNLGAAALNHNHTLDNLNGTLSISKGGTGATTAAAALTNLGAASSGHTHTLDNLSGTLSISKGGTGSTTAAAARSALDITPANIGAAPTSHNHTRSQITDFPGSMPASDVYSWAKQPSKPGYSYSEVGAAAASHGHNLVDLWGTLSVAKGGTGFTYVSGDYNYLWRPAIGTAGTKTVLRWGPMIIITGNLSGITISSTDAFVLGYTDWGVQPAAVCYGSISTSKNGVTGYVYASGTQLMARLWGTLSNHSIYYFLVYMTNQ